MTLTKGSDTSGNPDHLDSSKPTLFLHVGLPKTGSSFLQTMLALNADSLEQAGIRYPKAPNAKAAEAGKITSGNFLGWDAIGKLRTVHVGAGQGICISSELMFKDLCGSRSDNYWQLLAELSQLFNVVMIAFGRDPISEKVSRHQQLVKRAGLTEPLDAWIRSEHLPPILGLLRRTEQTRIGLVILNYSRDAANLWPRFLEVLGIATIKGFAWRYPSTLNVNRSLSEGELAFQLVANANDRRGPPTFISDTFCNLAPTIKKAIPALSLEAYRKFRQNIESQVVQVNELIPKDQNLVIESFNSEWHESYERSSSSQTTVLHRESWQSLVVEISRKNLCPEEDVIRVLNDRTNLQLSANPRSSGAVILRRTDLPKLVEAVLELWGPPPVCY